MTSSSAYSSSSFTSSSSSSSSSSKRKSSSSSEVSSEYTFRPPRSRSSLPAISFFFFFVAGLGGRRVHEVVATGDDFELSDILDRFRFLPLRDDAPKSSEKSSSSIPSVPYTPSQST